MPIGKPENLIGKQFSKLLVIGTELVNMRKLWVCKCECGNTTTATTGNLKIGRKKSCGCLRLETVKTASLTHGQSRGRKTKAYRAWAHIIGRCTNPTDAAFIHYGGRGITVSPFWIDSFEQFFNDMGEPPEGYTLERIDNNKGYSKENCKWASRYEQSRNTRRTIFISGVCLKDACRNAGVGYDAVQMRIRKGVPPEFAISMTAGAYKAMIAAAQGEQ